MDLNLISDDRETSTTDHGWQKVTYPKRNRKQKPSGSSTVPGKHVSDGVSSDKPNVFHSLEQQADDRRRRIADSRTAPFVEDDAPVRFKNRSEDDDDSDDSDASAAGENGGKASEPKKVKQKKPKKPKVTVAEAASKIDVADLAAFLVDVSGSYEGQHDIQLMRFADYFGRAFSVVSGAQFPWMKMFRESPVAKIADTPLCHISDALYKTSADWINQHPPEALGSFVLWCLDSILADLASQQAGAKGSKKAAQQQVPSKSQVAIFVVLAILLRRKPDVLVNLSSTLRETSKYQGQDKLPVIVWMICQAHQGDLCVGLYAWAHNLLPIVIGKSCNPQSRDLILQLVERILSMPKARTILVNGAVRKGERLMTPSALEILLQVTFPPSSARVKATERFEAIYPILKDVALAGVPGSKAMKQVSQQILSFAAKASGENNPSLSKEASGIFIWCLTQHADCYKQWEKIYQDNLEASVSVLKKLSGGWKEHSSRLSPYESLREALKSFRHKNEEMLADETNAGLQAVLKDADKYCKAILARTSRGHGCMKSMALLVIAMGLGAAFLSPDMKALDWEKLPLVFSEKMSELLVVVSAKLSEVSVVVSDIKGY